MPLPEVASLTLTSPSEPANALRLLNCLRQSFAPIHVGIAELDGGQIFVTDRPGSVGGIHDLLDERLDQCAERLNILDWRNHLLVDPK